MKKNTKYLKRGFTLVEMMIVVAIIAVLAGVALPQYGKYVKKSETVEGVALMRQIADAEILYKTSKAGYADFNTKTGSQADLILKKQLYIEIPDGAKFKNYSVQTCGGDNTGFLISAWTGDAQNGGANDSTIHMTHPKRDGVSTHIDNYVTGGTDSVPSCT